MEGESVEGESGEGESVEGESGEGESVEGESGEGESGEGRCQLFCNALYYKMYMNMNNHVYRNTFQIYNSLGCKQPVRQSTSMHTTIHLNTCTCTFIIIAHM